MSFLRSKARQPETIRTAQKDLMYTNDLTEDLSDILRMTGPRNWIKYNNICKLMAEIAYHGFAAINNFQTLGEEYTGIIQIDNNYLFVPSKVLQLSAIILEFGGEMLYLQVIHKLEWEINHNGAIVPEAKDRLKKLMQFMKALTSYAKTIHKTIFYLNSDKYQISKRLIGINYCLIRHWLEPDHSLYGYRILGCISVLQVAITVAVNSISAWKGSIREANETKIIKKPTRAKAIGHIEAVSQCVLCLELRNNTSLASCGHMFCWHCILEWLDERCECPLCRESVKKSNVIQLSNYV